MAADFREETNALTQESDQPTAPVPRPRSPWVFATIVFTMAVTFAMVALIYVRWFSWTEPSSMVAVVGDPAANGVVVEIVQVRAGGPPSRSVPIELNASNDYTARLFLEAGYYMLTAKRADRSLPSQTFELPAYRKLTISLAGRFPSTAPVATVPASPGRDD